MFENMVKFLKKFNKKEKNVANNSKDAAKERLHLVLMQDRANVSADFLELMKQEIIEVIKKYIEVDESAIDVRLTNKENEDGTNGAPALYANIPILNIKNEARKVEKKDDKQSQENKNQSNNEKMDENKKNTNKNQKEKNANNKEIVDQKSENNSEKSKPKSENDAEGSNSKTENKQEENKVKEDKEKKETSSENKTNNLVKNEVKKEKVKTEE